MRLLCACAAQSSASGIPGVQNRDLGRPTVIRWPVPNCVRIASTVAERYSVPRKRSFSAVAFATVILVPPVAAIPWMLIAFTEYVFISAKGTAALPH
jgi:hypothetical protein